MLLPPKILPSGAAIRGWGVQKGSKEPWVGDAICTLQSAEELVSRRRELVHIKGGHLDVVDTPPNLSKSLSNLSWRAENKGLDGFEVPSRPREVARDFGEVDRA